MQPQQQADAAADHPAPDDEPHADAHDPAAVHPAGHHPADDAHRRAGTDRHHAGTRQLMRITVTSGERQVFIQIKGGGRKKLAEAEATAQRLLAATPEPEPKKPVGFTLTSDTETE